jgi:DNA repair exonuclease SbcCD ATPase subunit
VKEAEKNNQEEINHFNDEIKKLEIANADLATKIINVDELIANTSVGDVQALQSLGMKIDTKINDKKKELKFYQVNDNCPSCKQSISESFRETTMRNLLQDIEKRETGLKELQAQFTAMKEKQQYVGELLKQKNDLQYQVKTNNDLIMKNGKKILALQAKNVLSDDMMNQAKKLHDELDAFNNERNQLLEDQAYYQAAVGLLKDGGIKAQIIKQYLPVINSLVNKYLSAMDFHISFELDEEFNETIKSRHRDDFTYDSFSEGEKQKIDIALLFAWRAVAKLKNSMNTNLLIMDEIFDSSLDGLGADLVLSILATLPEGTNVFVISHRELLHDRFNATIRFEKRNNFSEIVELET